jgi:uncharacterized protein (TIRG00374 family)
MKRKTKIILSTSIVGLLVFILVLNLVDMGNLFENLKQFSIFPFIAYLLVSLFMMMAGVYRWKVILEAHSVRVGFWRLFSFKISGFSLCYITPGALVGGEALRAYLLKRNYVSFTQGLSSVIIDKFFDLSIAALFTSVGIIVVISFFNISSYLKTALLLVTVLWVIALSFFLYGSLTRKGFFRHIVRFLRLHKIKALSMVDEKVEETEAHISQFFIHHKKEFRRAAVMSMVLWLLMFVEYKIATTVFGYDAGFIAVFLIICMVGFSYTFPVPGGLGILEATQASLHSIMGLRAARGLLLSLLIRARDIFWTILGVLFLYYHGVSLAKQISDSKK